MKVITVPSKAKNINVWIPFLIQNRYRHDIDYGSKIELDFNGIDFIMPFHLSSLACLIEEYWINGIDIRFAKCYRIDISDYLYQIKFFDFWKNGNRQNFIPSAKQTTLPLTKISRKNISSYVIRAENYFQDNFMNSKDLSPINISLAEVFNNICDHAESPVSGFSITQYYPNKNQICISVCDFGVGIPNTINRFLNRIAEQGLSDTKALAKSLERNFTIKSIPNNGGLGLDNIRSCALECGGEISIISNKAVLKVSKENIVKLYSLKNCFEGTLIKIILDTNKFEERESSFDFNFEF